MFTAKFLFLPGEVCTALRKVLLFQIFPSNSSSIQIILLSHTQYLEKSVAVNLISVNSGIPQNLEDFRDSCLFRNVFSC